VAQQASAIAFSMQSVQNRREQDMANTHEYNASAQEEFKHPASCFQGFVAGTIAGALCIFLFFHKKRAVKRDNEEVTRGAVENPVLERDVQSTAVRPSKNRSFNDERFKNFTSGFQSLVTAIGIIVGGVWVFITFFQLGTVNKARADIVALEHAAVEQPVLQIDLQTILKTEPKSNSRLIFVSAKLRNDGKRILEFKDCKIQVSRLNIDGSSITIDSKATTVLAQYINETGTPETMERRTLRPNQSRTVAIPITVPSTGNYLLQLATTYSGLELKNGNLAPSADVDIYAAEQSIVTVE
jgi:hypothetical protein